MKGWGGLQLEAAVILTRVFRCSERDSRGGRGRQPANAHVSERMQVGAVAARDEHWGVQEW
jgi:hypothetical protein